MKSVRSEDKKIKKSYLPLNLIAVSIFVIAFYLRCLCSINGSDKLLNVHLKMNYSVRDEFSALLTVKNKLKNPAILVFCLVC